MKYSILLSGLWCVFLYTPSKAQDVLSYQKPPKEIVELLEAPNTPSISLDNKRENILLMYLAESPSIADLAQPELRIAGIRINPQNYGLSRNRAYHRLTLRTLKDTTTRTIVGLPSKLAASEIRWSPDNQLIAFVQTEPQGRYLYCIDVKTARAFQVGKVMLNGIFGKSYEWMPDSKNILAYTVPSQKRKLPEANTVPVGPNVQENMGRQAPVRTYQDLLKNAYDESLFEYYAEGQLGVVSLSGNFAHIGKTALISNFSVSPNGLYVLTNTLQKPYSYLVPYNLFPTQVDILNIDGSIAKNLTSLPLRENIPTGFDATYIGQRNHNWRPDQPATIYWVEAQDEGNPKKQAAIRDKVYTLKAPFTSSAQELIELPLRYSNVIWSKNQVAWVYQNWRATRKEYVWAMNPNQPKKYTVIYDLSSEDRYNDPGSPLMVANESGKMELFVDKNKVILFGQGASPEGNRPFIDELDLNTRKTTRLWRSEAPFYENPIAMIDYRAKSVLTSRESATENPNYWMRSLLKKSAPIQITYFANPYPMLKEVKRELVKYKRKDGVDMQFELYLPAGYKKENGKLPALMWAYPREFKSLATASQASGSPYQFVRVSWGSPIYWVTQGYAVMDNASMPIVGTENKEPNDNFIEQLVMNAEAAIQAAEATGVIDTKRIGVGGHSYGAFMTAHLMAHTDLFAAGIARSGAYNRTLTPFGFQSEERTYWEAQNVYTQMSPFSYAHKIKEPLLLIHGEADNNSGTFPIQSERFYNALKGHGATTRLVMLPLESHGYSAKESVMHTLWEMHQWLEKYVKNKR